MEAGGRGSLTHICCYGWEHKEKARPGLQVLIVSLAPWLLAAASCSLLILQIDRFNQFSLDGCRILIPPPPPETDTNQHTDADKVTHTNLSTTQITAGFLITSS